MRITVSTLGTMGDVLPLARLVRALVERGHAVTVHAWAMYRDQLAPPGVELVEAGGGVTDADLATATTEALRAIHPVAQIRRFVRLFHTDALASAIATARRALAGADLAVINVIDHVAQAASDELRVPWVGWHARPLASPDASAGEDALLAEVDAELTAAVAQVTARAPRPIRVFRQGSAVLDLVAASPAVLASAPSVAPHTVITGHWLGPPNGVPLDAEIARFLSARPGPAVFVTFGTIPDEVGRLQLAIEACRRIGVRVVAQGRAPAAGGGDDVLVVARRLDYASVLPAFAGMLHHGGAGTTHEACRAGTPQLCIPHFGDQYFWAREISRRGLGPPALPHVQLALPPLVDRLRALVTTPAYRERSAQLASTVAAEDGVPIAVAAIEALAPDPDRSA